MIDRNKPYNELPLLPPKKIIETNNVLYKTISASRALAKLDGAVMKLPNPELFLDTIQLQEAKASSEIENILTTNDDLYQSIVADRRFENTATKEVISYKEALRIGLEKLASKPFITTNLCIEIVQCIKKNTSGIRTTPGTKLSNAKGETIYTPPEGEKVIRDKLANLEQFINNDESYDPFVKMALMHYQFEAIHPFADGNGRTGRILLLLYLKKAELLKVPAVYLSDYIIKNKSDYYENLRKVTENHDWETFVCYMLDMLEITSNKTLEKLNEIDVLMKQTSDKIRIELPKIYSKELIEVIFKLPYTKRNFLTQANLGTSKTVGNYLKSLEEIGILKSVKVGKEKLYLNHQLMDILENN